MRNKSGQPDSSSGITLLCNKQLSKVPDDIPESPIYLDLSSNHIKNLDFSKDFNTLISLHLNENPLNKLDNIRFNNLRSLSLDFCNLNSMKQIPQLPNLISLSLVGNSLSSFENFHIFPNLTKIDLRGNSVSFTPIHTLAAVCSLRLSTINGRSVTEKEFQTAFSLSPIVGHALRKGRNPTPQSDEKAASLSFLSKENPLDVKNIGGCLVIRCPIEETSNVKWYQSSSNELEWELLDCTSRTLPVTPMMFQRLIKCEYGNKSFYTSDVIQKDDSDRNCLSFTDQPAIIGSGTVGSILSLNSQQSFPTKINWRFSNSPDSIGSCPVLIVPPEAKGQKIIAEVFPFSPVFEKVSFAPLTTEIQVSNVQETELIRLSIPDTIIEDEPFEIDYETYPANAKLHFTIDSANSFESPFTTIANLKSKTTFTPTSNEVGKFLRVTTFVGDRQYSAYSKFAVEKVKATLKRSLICGENKTNRPRIFLFEFSDGVEASGYSQRWFVQKEGENEAKKTFISDEKIVVPTDEYQGFILGVDVTVWFDNESSQKDENNDEILRKEQSFTIVSESPIEKGEKTAQFDDLKQPVEDSKIAMQKPGQWLISDIHARGGFRAIVESEIYTPRSSDIGKFIRFCSEETDLIIGPVLPSQSPIRSIVLKTVLPGQNDTLSEISSDLSVGSIVRAQLNFYQDRVDPTKDDLRLKWIRCSRGAPDRVIQEGGNEYIISYSDYGSKIRVRLESTDWQKDSDLTPIIKRGDYNGQIIRGKPLIGSQLTVQFNSSPTSTNSTSSYHSSDSYNNEPKTIKWYHSDESDCLCEGTLFIVRFIDVNHRIRCEVNGKYNELTDLVPPVNVEEGQVIKFTDVFHRDLTEKTGVLWFRYVFEESEWKEISSRTSYKLKRADVNSVIRVVSYQINNDGTKTSEIFADIGPITAKLKNSSPRSERNSAILDADEEEIYEESGNERIVKNSSSSSSILAAASSSSSTITSVKKKKNNKRSKSRENFDYDEDEDENEKDSKQEISKSKKTNLIKTSSSSTLNKYQTKNSTASNKTQNFDEYDEENNESSLSSPSDKEISSPTKKSSSSSSLSLSTTKKNKNNYEEEDNNEVHRSAHLQFTKHGQLVIVGDFDENENVKFFWRRWRGRKFDEIKDTSTRKMTPCFSMIGCEIDGGFQIPGSYDIVWTNKVFIDHALPAPDSSLVENGALVPGCVLEVRTPSPPPRYSPREQLIMLKKKIEEKQKKKQQQQQKKQKKSKKKNKIRSGGSEFDENISLSSEGEDENEEEEEGNSSESSSINNFDFDFNLPIGDDDQNIDEDDDIQTLRIKFAWKRWNGMNFSRISNDSSIYNVTEEDTDCYVCCDVYYIDKDGNHGPRTSVETSAPVSSESVIIEGETFVGCTLNAEGYDDFMRTCRFIWQRLHPNNKSKHNNKNEEEENLIDNEEEDDDEAWEIVGKKRAYRCSCDDVGSFIRVVCESRDERRISNTVGPILMNRDVEYRAREIVKNGSFRFKSKEQNGVRWKIEASSSQFSITSKINSRSAPWKNVEIRAAVSSDKKVEIFVGSFRVSVVPVLHSNNGNEEDSSLDRDVCILALRIFKERAMQSNSPSFKKK